MVGQEKLVNKVDKLSLSQLPHSIIMVGQKGCGKRTLCNYIASKLHIELKYLKDICCPINSDNINIIYETVYPCLYIIDGDVLTVKEQNSILKLIEEPISTAYFVITCENTSILLATIVNRCQLWQFESYSKDVLLPFIPSNIIADYVEIALQIAETPGQLKDLEGVDIEGLVLLAKKVVEKIGIASFPNTLTISDKIAFKDEKNKFSCHLFIKTIIIELANKYRDSSDDHYIRAYNAALELSKALHIANIDLKYLFENFIINLWNIMRQ